MDLTPRPIGRPRSCTCGTCERCKHADYMRGWYQAKTPEQRRAWVALRDQERVKAADRERSRSAAKRASIERSQARHPEKYAARRAVHAALKRGDMVRQPCACGSTRSEAHHPDYSQPLLVEWLCRRHHTKRHPRSGEVAA